MSVLLRDVTQDNWRIALRLTVHPDQQRFVADYAPVAALALTKAYIRPNDYHYRPLLAYTDSDAVGFLLLGIPPRNRDEIWLYHFFIDQAFQHQGHGSTILTALCTFVQNTYPSIKQLSLTVHPENQVAQRLYLRFGFQASGEYRDNEPIYQLYLPKDKQSHE